MSDNERFDLVAPAVVKPSSTHRKEEEELEIGILKQFPFSSELQVSMHVN